MAKGNPPERNVLRTQRRASTPSALERVRQAAQRDRKQRFTALLHHVYDVARLRAAYLALHDLAHELCDGRWVATGGGGYQVYAVVPRAWTIYYADLAGADLPDEVPEEWVERAREAGADEVPRRFEDPLVQLPAGRREEATEAARAAAEETVERVFGFWDL